jgi:GTPase
MSDWIERPNGMRVPRVFVSARDGTGLSELRRVISDQLWALAARPADVQAEDSSPDIVPFPDPNEPS